MTVYLYMVVTKVSYIASYVASIAHIANYLHDQ